MGLAAVLVVLLLAPLTVFTPHLLRARREGLRQYGVLASRYVDEFDQEEARDPMPTTARRPEVGRVGDAPGGHGLLSNAQGIRRRLFSFASSERVMTAGEVPYAPIG